MMFPVSDGGDPPKKKDAFFLCMLRAKSLIQSQGDSCLVLFKTQPVLYPQRNKVKSHMQHAKWPQGFYFKYNWEKKKYMVKKNESQW